MIINCELSAIFHRDNMTCELSAILHRDNMTIVSCLEHFTVII